MMGHFCTLPTEKTFVLFSHGTSPPPRLLASQRTDHAKPSKDVFSIALRVLADYFEGRRWPVSGGLAWDVGGWPISVSSLTFNLFFRSEMTSCAVQQRIHTELDPARYHAARESSRRRPLPTALELAANDSLLSGAYTLYVL